MVFWIAFPFIYIHIYHIYTLSYIFVFYVSRIYVIADPAHVVRAAAAALGDKVGWIARRRVLRCAIGRAWNDIFHIQAHNVQCKRARARQQNQRSRWRGASRVNIPSMATACQLNVYVRVCVFIYLAGCGVYTCRYI